MAQFDWVQLQAEKHRRLLRLRSIIEKHRNHEEPFSESIIRTTLLLIRRDHGAEAELETCRIFRLQEDAAIAA